MLQTQAAERFTSSGFAMTSVEAFRSARAPGTRKAEPDSTPGAEGALRANQPGLRAPDNVLRMTCAADQSWGRIAPAIRRCQVDTLVVWPCSSVKAEAYAALRAGQILGFERALSRCSGRLGARSGATVTLTWEPRQSRMAAQRTTALGSIRIYWGLGSGGEFAKYVSSCGTSADSCWSNFS